MSRIRPRHTMILTTTALAAASIAGSASAASEPTFSVDATGDTADADPGDGLCADAEGACTLRAAIQEANALGGSVDVHLPAGLYVLGLAGAGENAAATGDLDITAHVEIHGDDATIDANGTDRAFHVTGGASLHLHDLMITGGRVGGGADPIVGSGGAIANAGSTYLSRVTLVGNVAEGTAASGGAILNTGVLHVENSTMSGNTATRAGGAIEANGGTTVVTDSHLDANETGDGPGNGGALHLTGAGDVHVVGALVTDNVATEGGGLWNSAVGEMHVVDSVFEGNIGDGAGADQGGGALFNDGGSLTVRGSELSHNHATGASGSGGGILSDGGTLEVVDTVIRANSSNRAGGGIETTSGATATIANVALMANSTGSAPGNGGGLHVTGNGDTTITRSVVKQNRAAAEGGGLWNGTGTMSVVGTQVSANSAAGAGADQGGGGLFNAGGTLIVDDSNVFKNVADGTAGSGGGILNDQGDLVVTGTKITRNSSMRAGGGVEANLGFTSLHGVRLEANSTGSAPGNGGGFHVSGAGTVEISDSRVFRNTATTEGGGLWNHAAATMRVTDTEIRKNDAPTGPDVFNQPGGDFTIDGEPVPAG